MQGCSCGGAAASLLLMTCLEAIICGIHICRQHLLFTTGLGAAACSRHSMEAIICNMLMESSLAEGPEHGMFLQHKAMAYRMVLCKLWPCRQRLGH